MVKKGQQLEVEILHLTGDGKGVAYAPDETMIVVEDISTEDKVIKIQITQVFEESAFAKKVARVKAEARKPSGPGIVESPYEMEEDEDEDEYGY